MKVGRPKLRTPELVDELCNRIASGRSIMSVCNDNDMPESGTVYRWREECSEFNEKIDPLPRSFRERAKSEGNQRERF